MAFVKRYKHESFEHFMRRSQRANRRDGTYDAINRYHKYYFAIGPRKRRQLKSKKARQRNRAIKKRNKRRARIKKARLARRL